MRPCIRKRTFLASFSARKAATWDISYLLEFAIAERALRRRTCLGWVKAEIARGRLDAAISRTASRAAETFFASSTGIWKEAKDGLEIKVVKVRRPSAAAACPQMLGPRPHIKTWMNLEDDNVEGEIIWLKLENGRRAVLEYVVLVPDTCRRIDSIAAGGERVSSGCGGADCRCSHN